MLIILAALGTVIEMIVRGERQSVASRLRGLVFWFIYTITGFVIAFFFQRGFQTFKIAPLLAIDLTHTPSSPNTFVRLAAFTIFPFLATFVFDFFYYWMHRTQHVWRPLWREHSVHHSIRELNVCNDYHHWLEPLLHMVFTFLPLSLLIRVNPPSLVIVGFIYRLSQTLVHANSPLTYGPLKYVFAEPRYHRIRHSIERQHWDKNFAAFFPFWDIVFGTAYFPCKEEYPATGLVEQDEPRTVGDYLFMPFRRPQRAGAQDTVALKTAGKQSEPFPG